MKAAVYASVRDRTAYEALPRRPLPERLTVPWTLALLGVDVLATLAACYAAGVPPDVGPAACVVLCAAMTACGAYQRSYAVHWRDEAYHVFVGCVLAALPFWLVVHAIGGVATGTAVTALAISAIAIASMHALLHRARHAAQVPAHARAAFATPEAQWRETHSIYRSIKRAADVALAAIGLTLLSPLMVAAALCIVAESGMPFFFRQARVGRSGVPFEIFKFRTMVRDAGSAWARPSDARITPLGAFLRRFSIDELPQLINVLRGEMSLVGPRPEMESFAREFRRTIPHYEERHVVLPGVTGWAQVQLKRNLEPRDMPYVVPYDLFYVEHASLVLDAIVVVKTAVEFLFHRAV